MTNSDRIEMGKRIKVARDIRNITLEGIADEIGVAKSTIQRYETGKIKTPKIPVVNAIANALNVNPSWLVMKSDSMEIEQTVPYPDFRPVAQKSFPLFDGIACGEPRLMPDGIDVYVDITTDIKADFVLKCHGDSMIGARIYDGDLVFIRQQEAVENGEIAAVGIGDEATLKRVYFYPEKSLLILKAENPNVKDIIISDDELQTVTIFGKAIAFQSDVR